MKQRVILSRRRAELGSERQYLQLFGALVALFVLQAALIQTAVSTLIEVVVAGAALILAFRLAEVPRRIVLAISGVVGLAIVAAIGQLIFGQTENSAKALGVVNLLLLAAGTPALITATLRHSSISMSTVLGAMTIYVAIGLFFASLYHSFVEFNPASFVTSNGPLTPSATQYLSFVTITTVGFGDITPVTNLARTTVALEALIGQVYLVTVVALVVGRLGSERRARPPK